MERSSLLTLVIRGRYIYLLIIAKSLKDLEKDFMEAEGVYRGHRWTFLFLFPIASLRLIFQLKMQLMGSDSNIQPIRNPTQQQTSH